MKKFIKNITGLFIVMSLIFSLQFTATAEETETELFNNDKEQDIAVYIGYEKNDITFTLISPSGVEITKDTDTENITVFSGSTSTIVFLGNAETGQWKIKYDKGSNESLSVHASVQDSSFWITSFTKDEISENTIPLKFYVSGAENIRYNYSVILTTDTESLDGRTLLNGSATVGEDVSVDVSLKNVSTYSDYHLLLYVSYESDGSEIFDYAYSDSFDYTNENSPEPIDDIDITISHDSGSITADWSDHITWNISSVFVEYYIDDKFISSTEYPVSDGKSGFFTYEDENSLPKLKISIKNKDGLVSDYSVFEVPISTDKALNLKLPESGKTGSEIWSFEYENADNTTVNFEINGKSDSYTLNGNGSKYISLPEKRNTIVITYTDSLGNIHQYNRVANISISSPTLELLNSIDGVKTQNDAIIISGKTNASVLTINDEEIAIQNGNFVYKYELDDGDNSIVILASTGDSTTTLTATVTKESSGIFSSHSNGIISLLPLIIGLLVSAVGITLIIIFSKKKKAINNPNVNDNIPKAKVKKVKRQKNRKPGFVLLILSVISWVIAIALWVWFIIRKVFENGTGFIKLAKQSLKAADAYLLHTTILLIVAIIVSVIAVILTIIFIIIRIIKNPNRPSRQMIQQSVNTQPFMQQPVNTQPFMQQPVNMQPTVEQPVDNTPDSNQSTQDNQ